MNEKPAFPYATHLDIKFPALSLVDVPSLVEACTDRWYNQTLCKVNDSVIRLGVMQGEYHWHKHDDDDEFFFVLDGHFIVDLEEQVRGPAAARRLCRPEGRPASHASAGEGRHSHGRDGGHRPDGRRLTPRVPRDSMVFKEIVFGTAEYRLECDLRHAVLREPLGLSFTAEELATEENQLHFGLFEPEDNLIACVVAVRLSPTDARIRQMAVSPGHQRRGLGTRLMKRARGASAITGLQESRPARAGIGRGVL